MKYITRAVVVDAYRILSVGPVIGPEHLPGWGYRKIQLDNGQQEIASRDLLAYIKIPQVGDYYVVEQDGRIYICSKEAFELRFEAAK